MRFLRCFSQYSLCTVSIVSFNNSFRVHCCVHQIPHLPTSVVLHSDTQDVRGLKIAMRQYSSFCVSAVVLNLGGVDIQDGVPGKDQVECGREEVEDGEKQERETAKEQPTNAQTHNITDGIRME